VSTDQPDNESPPVQEDQVLVGRYKILGRLGTGGTSAVFKARDLVLKRDIAVKLLKTSRRSEDQLVRLQREARAICQLNHKNIIEVYDFVVTEDNTPILAMEYIEGESLEQLVKRDGPLELSAALTVFEQICSALSYAHYLHIMHRDLKPSNVIVQDRKTCAIKVIDFGIAKMMDEDGSLTGSGVFVGTPSYVSPEQARGDKEIDRRTDIYSIGCLMYRTLTGKTVFRGSMMETLQAHINQPAPTLKQGNPDIDYPEALEKIVAKTLEKSPEDRYRNMKTLAADLSELRTTLDEGESGDGDSTDSETQSPLTHQLNRKRDDKQTIKLILLAVLVVLISSIYVFLVNPIERKERAHPLPPDALTQAEVQKDTEAQIRRRYDIEKEEIRTWTWHKVSEGKVTNEQLLALRQLNVTRLRVSATSITDEQLKLLVPLPLVALDIRDTSITNAGVKFICQKMPKLRCLLIERCNNIDSRGYIETAKLKELAILSLRDTDVGNEDLEHISTLPKLVLLYVANSPNIDDDAIDEILKLKDLHSLRIDGTKITPQAINRLRTMPKLLFIGAGHLNLTDDTMPVFSDHISMLDFTGNRKLTIKGLKQVLAIKGLWYIDVRDCPGIYNDRSARDLLFKTFKQKDGRVALTDEMKGFESNEFYFDPEYYADSNQVVSIEDRRRLFNEPFSSVIIRKEDD